MGRFALALVLTVAAGPALAGASAFDAFKTVCIDTKIDLDAVRRAGKAAGGVAGRSESVGGPWANTVVRWSFKGFAIEAAEIHIPALPGAPAKALFQCTMTGFKPDQRALARLDQWAGVPREKGATIYTFLDRGGKHLPIPRAHDAYFAALESGQSWQVGFDEAAGTLTLVHYLTP